MCARVDAAGVRGYLRIGELVALWDGDRFAAGGQHQRQRQVVGRRAVHVGEHDDGDARVRIVARAPC